MGRSVTPVRPSPRYATLLEAAAYVRLNEVTIRRWIAGGKLTEFRQGRRIVRVDLNEIDAMMAPGGQR